MVASFDPTVLRTLGVRVISELWENDISAELAVDTSSLEELLAKYKDDNHGWIIIAKLDSMERGFKVKNIQRKEDIDVRSSELVSWIRSELRSRNQRGNLGETSKFPRHNSQQDSSALARTRDPDIRVLAAQHKGKKTNRRNIIESGSYPPTSTPTGNLLWALIHLNSVAPIS